MHQRTIVGGGTLLLALIIAFLHFMANQYYLYWSYWWADIVMHCLGGLFIGLSAFWFLRYEVPIGVRNTFPHFPVAFVAMIVVGLVWEYFEFVTGAHASFNYPLDTLLDFSTNIAGFLLAYLFFKHYVR